MSVSWSVLPLDQSAPGLVDWLQRQGLEVPTISGRDPTLSELSDALSIFRGQRVFFEPGAGELQEVFVGELGSETYAHLLGSVVEPSRPTRALAR